ncbi:hypothetical protein [Phyllobacterium phragmitis]|nr:hypothetical protein [Phyllobacterium phragmitis]
MVQEKEATLRRVYVLPQELVDRIVAFQNEKGYGSEVEAVRKLLDEALKSRDTYETIIKRFLSRLEALRMPAEVARDVLVGHPLITELKFERDSITFRMTNGYNISIQTDGTVSIEDEYNTIPWPPYSADKKSAKDLDDEIPF